MTDPVAGELAGYRRQVEANRQKRRHLWQAEEVCRSSSVPG